MYKRKDRSMAMLLAAMAILISWSSALAEVIYLKNGDIIHGNVVGVTTQRLTLNTPYGRLVIPKTDVQRIEYLEGERADAPPGVVAVEKGKPESRPEPPPPPKPKPPVVSFEIRGRSFWYAFDSPSHNPADLSIRLRLYFDDVEVATLMDSRPDTVDRNTYFNSFTFSPIDSQVLRSAEGVDCRVQKTDDGRVMLSLTLPESQKTGQVLVRMLYQVNGGSTSLPRWIDAVSRTFPIEVEAAKESYVVLEQDASGLDYSGFFKKTMKNVETFQVEVVSSELRESGADP